MNQHVIGDVIGGALLGVITAQYLPEGRAFSAVIFLLAMLLAAVES